jgi:predicted HAD superfamily Cof-like phosphohydrolase
VTSVAGPYFSLYSKKKDKMTLAQVKEFNDIYEVPRSDVPTTRVPADKLRYDLIAEEFEELREAYDNFDIVEIADALGDIQYVVHGAIDVFGLEEIVEKLSSGVITNRFPKDIFTEHDQEFHLLCLKDAILRNETTAAARVLLNILQDLDTAAAGYNIDLDYVVAAIHKSNLTKLGENGEVIRRPEDNKVLKGPNYKEPTGDIRAYLYDGVKDADLLG